MNNAMLKIIIVTGVLAIVRIADARQAIFSVRHAEDVRSKDVVDHPFTVQYYDHHKRTPFSNGIVSRAAKERFGSVLQV